MPSQTQNCPRRVTSQGLTGTPAFPRSLLHTQVKVPSGSLLHVASPSPSPN